MADPTFLDLNRVMRLHHSLIGHYVFPIEQISLVLDLADIGRVGEQSVQTPFVELTITPWSSLLRRPRFVPPITVFQFVDDRQQRS